MRRVRFGFNIRAFKHLSPSSSFLRRTRQTPEIFPAKWQRVASYSRVNRNDSFPRLFLDRRGIDGGGDNSIFSYKSHINTLRKQDRVHAQKGTRIARKADNYE